MIELRLLVDTTRFALVDGLALYKHGELHGQARLQFRWNRALVGINTGTWSEWQDVPIVSETTDIRNEECS